MEPPRIDSDGAWALQYLWEWQEQVPPGSDAWNGGWRSLPPCLAPTLRGLAEAGFIDLKEAGDMGSVFPLARLRREEFEAAFGPGPYRWR
jgi:hypothetical protein